MDPHRCPVRIKARTLIPHPFFLPLSLALDEQNPQIILGREVP